MRCHPRATLALATLAGTVCSVTGVVYVGASASAGMAELGPWLASLAAVGASALCAGGLWQLLGEGVPRLIALLVLAALSAGYALANVLALVQGSAAGIPQTPWGLHVAGLTTGGVLYVVTLVETSVAFHARSNARAPHPIGASSGR